MPSEFDPDHIDRLKQQVLEEARENGDPQAEIVSSWRRSQAAIGAPAAVRDVPHVPESLLDEHLLDMFGAPMNRFAQDLDGTGLAVLLADSRGQVLQRWVEDRQAQTHLERVGTTRGAVLAENLVGTNGVGSVATTGRAMQVRGAEHYAELYRDAVCTGAPVLHPITGSLLAVVTLSCDLTPRSDLLMPLVKTMTSQLEQHVLAVEHPDTRRMFHAFLDLTRRNARPVLAFGPQGVVVQSQHVNTLNSSDVALLRALGDESRDGHVVVELSTGRREVELRPIGAGHSIVVVGERLNTAQITVMPPAPRLIGESGAWRHAVSTLERFRKSHTTVLVHGEPGTGKTSLALGVPFRAVSIPAHQVVIDAAERHIVGTREWLTSVRADCETAKDVIIRGIETLDAPALDGLRMVVAGREGGGQTLLTMVSQDAATAEEAALRFDAGAVPVPPLRERRADIPDLWRAMRAVVAPGSRLEVDEEAARLVEGYHWPGNLKEMRHLLAQLAATHRTGLIGANHLPPVMHASRSLTLIERVELETIRKALEEANGNRVKAADILGISRATVYRKMKAYRLVG